MAIFSRDYTPKDHFEAIFQEYWVKIFDKNSELNTKFKSLKHAVKKYNSDLDRLTSDQLELFRNNQDSLEMIDYRRKIFQDRPIEKTIQGLLKFLVDKILLEQSSIRTVLNIGVRYGYVDNLLAQNYPNVNFIGVDFNRNLKEFNKDFENTKNLEFISGYALEMMESGVVKPDLAMFSSTAVVIPNKQLTKYFEVINKHCKHLVVNEPIIETPSGKITNPETLSTRQSAATHFYEPKNSNEIGELCFVHNYKKMAKEAGFKISFYQVYKPTFTKRRYVQLIAESIN